MYRWFFCFVLSVCALLAVLAAAADARVIRVKWDSPNDGPGDDWGHAYRTIWGAINNSKAGDEVWVAGDSGHPYLEYSNIVLRNEVAYYGGFAGTEDTRAARDWKTNVTVIEGTGGENVVTITPGASPATVFDGFTTKGGRLFCNGEDTGSSPRVRNNTVRGSIHCYVTSAFITENDIQGGITCYRASPTIANNSIYGGGELIRCSDTSATITGNTLKGLGTTGEGAGIFCQVGQPTVTGNTIENTPAGVRCHACTPRISGNTIRGNRVGVICDWGGTFAILGNRIEDNSYCGLLCVQGYLEAAGNIVVNNGYCGIEVGGRDIFPTITNNTVTSNGSVGIRCTAGASTIANNIVAFHSVAGIYCMAGTGAIATLSHNCLRNPGGVDYDGVTPGVGDINADPQFVAKEAGDFHLSAWSPCVGTGSDEASGSVSLDIDGQPRKWGTHVDIGADEFVPPTAPVVRDDGIYTTSLTHLHATWEPAQDPVYAVSEYQYAVGTAATDPGDGYVVPWTDVGAACEATHFGLALQVGETYYWYVRGRNVAGAWSGIGVSDGILVTSPIEHLAEIKSLPLGTSFTLAGLHAVSSSADFPGYVFVEDSGRAAGMRVNVSNSVSHGDVLAVAGRVNRVEGEWQIDLLQPPAVVDGPEPKPLFMTQRSLVADLNEDLTPESGLDPTGLLVKIVGKITRINTGQHVFYVNDGSDLADGMGPSDGPYVGIRVSYRTFTPPAVGKRVSVTGILRVEKATLAEDAFVNGEYRHAGETLYLPVVCPRAAADIVVLL